MIEDEKLGLKIAEDEEEALFNKVKEEAEQLIKQSKENYILQKAMLQMAKEKLKKYKKSS